MILDNKFWARNSIGTQLTSDVTNVTVNKKLSKKNRIRSTLFSMTISIFYYFLEVFYCISLLKIRIKFHFEMNF